METGVCWYVVHTHARAESKAMHHLRRQGFAVFLPQYRKRRRHARRTDWVSAPLFPRYLFVALNLAKARWWAIASTVGVHHLVCQGDRPAAVPEGVVDSIEARMDEDGLVPIGGQAALCDGDAVEVTSGALADRLGAFDGLIDDARVAVLLELLGRRMRVVLPLDSIAPAG